MKALSIRQPWAWAILKAGKDIENRDWPTSLRGRFAIHTAKGMTRDEYQSAIGYITQAFVKNILRKPVEHQIGAGQLNIATGELVMPDFEEIIRGAIVGVTDLVDCLQFPYGTAYHGSPWFEGKYGFILKNVIALPEPIPCKGALNFWEVPDDISAQIEEQLRRGK